VGDDEVDQFPTPSQCSWQCCELVVADGQHRQGCAIAELLRKHRQLVVVQDKLVEAGEQPHLARHNA
jgi:hypothetical protein